MLDIKNWNPWSTGALVIISLKKSTNRKGTGEETSYGLLAALVLIQISTNLPHISILMYKNIFLRYKYNSAVWIYRDFELEVAKCSMSL